MNQKYLTRCVKCSMNMNIFYICEYNNKKRLQKAASLKLE